MTFNTKIFEVVFGWADDGDEIPNDRSFTVQAETGERAIEIARDLLPKKGRAEFFVHEIHCRVFQINA